MTNYKQHPLSAAFPAMTDTAFAELRADLAANGLRYPITLMGELVLDGWHRYRGCQDTGTTPRFEQFAGDDDDARKFVVSSNLQRRHLDTSQRGLVAARFATLAHGTNQHSRSAGERNSALLVEEAARLFNVSKDTVKDSRTVLASATLETIARVENGELAVSRAAREVRAAMPKPVLAPKQPPSPPSEPPVVIRPQTIEEWDALSPDARTIHLAHRNPDAKLNQQSSGEDDNLIDWAKWTWNPITGCNHTCPYCYARDIAERFAGTPSFPNGFTPTFRADRIAAPLNYRPRTSDDPRERRIFTGSMTDLFGRWVPAEWINAILNVANDANAWEFLILTKFPRRMAEFAIPPNVWMGTSVDCQARVDNAEAAFERVNAKVKWLSCEPLLEPLRFRHLNRFNLIVIGGASESRHTPRWIPPFAWLDDLMRQADAAGCRVFLKSNLYRKEQPFGPRYIPSPRAPDVFNYLRPAAA
jgi:protein gp37